MYSVSVIMPVYNNEKTLRKAIDSVLNQTMYGFELILVNDGSTDASPQICDEYAKKEPLLVEVIHQEHLGLAVARNKGLFNSSGKYIYFADATDTFDQRMLQSNIKLAEEKNADLVVFGFSTISNDKTGEIDYHLPRMPFLPYKNEFRNHYRNFHHFYPYELFNKLYKREYLLKNRIKFKNLPLLEGAFFNLYVYKKIDSVAFNRVVHCHRKNIENSQQKQYHEDIYKIQMAFVRGLEAMFEYWKFEYEYIDLIVEEYYNAANVALKNITSSDSPFSMEQQAEIMTEILSSYEMQEKLHEINSPINKNIYTSILLSHFQTGNGQAAVKLINRRNMTKSTTSQISKVMQKIFNRS